MIMPNIDINNLIQESLTSHHKASPVVDVEETVDTLGDSLRSVVLESPKAYGKAGRQERANDRTRDANATKEANASANKYHDDSNTISKGKPGFNKAATTIGTLGGASVAAGAIGSKILHDKMNQKTQGAQLKDAATSKLSDVVDKGKEIAGTVKQAGGDALQSVKDNPKAQAALAGAAGLTALGVGAKKYLSKKK